MAREIIIRKDAGEPILDKMQETWMGHLQGAMKQYRHGRMHIREYKDHYTMHEDTVDPRQDPVGHIVHDAPEFLGGILGGAVGIYAGNAVRKETGSLLVGIIAGAILVPILFKIGMDTASSLKRK